MPWTRPAEVPIGQVWQRFQGKDKDGNEIWYQIRDVEDQYKEKCLELLRETFLTTEPLSVTLGVPSDPVSIDTINSNWVQYLTQNVSLGCFTEVDEKPSELVAFNVTLVRSMDDKEEDLENVKGEPWKKLLKTLIAAEEKVDVFQRYGVDKYFTCSGMTVAKGYRGQNIGVHLLAAREPFCKALGLKATASVFTAIASQKCAQKCGYEVLAELPYTEMLKQDIDLKDCDTKIAQVMGKKFEDI